MKNEAIIHTVDNNTAIYQSLTKPLTEKSKPPKFLIVKKNKQDSKPLDIENIKQKIEHNKIFSSVNN